MEKRQLLQQMLLGKLDTCQQKTETRSMFVTLYKYQLKEIKDLNIRPETLKLVQERAGNILEATSTSSAEPKRLSN
jgi:dTDP-4-amino-4,6-dideoxygalactose transaminase